jgi:hypothetical protein
MPQKLKPTLDEAIKVVNLKKVAFKFTYLNVFCGDMRSAHKQLIPFPSVLVCSRLYEMRPELRISLGDNSFQVSKCSTDISRPAVMAYRSDVFTYVNGLNLSAQGKP